MAGETPGGGAVQTGGGEGVEAQLGSAAVDVVSDLLQGLEVGDVGDLIAGFLQQRLVHDDTVGLQAVADGDDLTVGVLQGIILGGQLVVHVAAAQVVAELTPGSHAALVALEQGGRVFLVHLGHQGGLIIAGGGGEDLDGHAGLLGVGGGQSLPGVVRLRLKVQIVHAAGGGVAALGLGVVLLLTAGHQRQGHHESKKHCKKLLHGNYSFFVFIFTSQGCKKQIIRVQKTNHWDAGNGSLGYTK